MLVLYLDPVRGALSRAAHRAARGIARVAHLGERPAPQTDSAQLGHADAGWVQVLDMDSGRLRGRGRLMLRNDGARVGGAPAIDARIESFVPAEDPPLVPQDHVLLLV